MDEIIYLLATKDTINKIGDPIKEIEKRQRYATITSVKKSEIYQAAAIGLKPEIMVEIWKFEYAGEQFIEYKEKNYKVIRTYEKSDEKIELTCVSISNAEVKAYVCTKCN